MANILIVDDVGADRQILATILGAQGHRLREAANGRDALALIRAEPPDLVITDLLMPRMDGLTCTARLARQDPNAKVIIITGGRTTEADAVGAGAQAFIEKPFGIEELGQVIHSLDSRP